MVLGLASFFTDVASEMVYPLVPLFLTASLGASPAVLGLVEGLAESTANLLKVFAGYLSDRVRNRKGLTIVGYTVSGLGKVLLATATGWGVLLLGRVGDRLGKGIRTAPRDALVADSVVDGRHGAAFGLHRALDSSGAVVGVLLAYAFLTRLQGDYAAVFRWSLVPAALGILVLFLVREPPLLPPGIVSRPLFDWRALPPRLQRFLLLALVFALGNSSNAFLLLRAGSLGMSSAGTVLLYLAYNVVYAVVSYPAGSLSDRIGRKRLLVAGYAFFGVVYLGFATVGEAQAWLLWPLFVLYGVYSGLTDGMEKALIADLAPADARATALGLHGTFVSVGLLVASLGAGQLWDHVGAAAVFYVGGVMGLATAVAMACLL